MKPIVKKIIIIGTFTLVAFLGLLVSFSAPYVASGDELVYLTGALQVKDGGLPDAYMLQGYDYNAYLYPKLISLWYELLGYEIFKTIYLFLLVIVTGISAYVMFRVMRLSWVPALLLSVVALMPRFSSGTEIFGVLTFHEAIGRQAALPLFFL